MGWLKRSTKRTIRQSQLEPNGYVFRRSRTLTGTTSNQIVAPVNTHQHLKTTRQRLHELYQVRRRIIGVLCTFCAVIFVLIWLLSTFINTFNIVDSPQGRGGALSGRQEVYQQSLTEYFDQHPLERFGFLLQPANLQTFMLQQHTELSSFATSRQWYGGGVRFAVHFRTAILAWQTGGNRFYVDATGMSFTHNGEQEPSVQVTDQSGISSNSGELVVPRRFIYFLGKVVGAVNANGQDQVVAVVIPASSREIDLKLQNRNYPIKTDIDRDPLQTAQDIGKVLTYMDAHHIKPQYIDARVQGRAFYKE